MFFIAPLVLASTLIADASAGPTGYTSQSPVQVQACSVVADASYYPTGGGDATVLLPQPTRQILNIKFANSTSKQISSVTFALTNDGHQLSDVVDSGKFSPGVTISHKFFSPDPGAHVGCTVSSVAFSDGSTWQGPQVTAARK